MNKRLPGLMLVALLVGACAGSKKTAPTPPATTVPPVQPNATAPVATVAAPVASTPATTAATVPSVRLVYFDFDSSEIRPEFTAPIAEHARALSRNASIKVRLEGHTDERGSREYNIGLGERRAQSVRRALLLQGVAEGQLTTLSYGEEKPAAAGSSEAAWAKNRRVELVYLN